MDSKVPSFWQSRPEQVDKYVVTSLSKGRRTCLTASAGGRPVWAVTYGPEGRGPATTNFSAVSGTRRLSAYLGEERPDEPPVVVVLAATHGGEMEGVVGAINLMHVLETGSDLRGQAWPELNALAGDVRLVIVPLHNPDGRARVTPDSLAGMTFPEFRYWAQGQWPDGRLIGHPTCKLHQPLNPEDVAFLGGYPNELGYNIHHDVSLSGPKTPEARAALALVERERPDCVLLVHSCEFGPFLFLPDPLVPKPHQRVQAQMRRRLHEQWDARGLRPASHMQESDKEAHRPLFNLSTAMYATSGAVPLVFEGPHGLAQWPYTHDEILDIHLVLYQEVLRGVKELPIRSRLLNARA